MQKDKGVATHLNLVCVLLDRDVYIMCSDNILPTDGERGYFTSTFTTVLGHCVSPCYYSIASIGNIRSIAKRK